MKICHDIIIEADIDSVWPFIADPVLQSLWNPKIVAVDRTNNGPVTEGETFQSIYELNHKQRTTNVTVTQCHPPLNVEFDHHMIWQQKDQHHIESYILTQQGQSVHVQQTIDISMDGVPLIAKLLIRFISAFGKSQSTQPLTTLKNLIQNPPVA